MADYNANLWAPWRMAYIRSLAEQQKESGCFLCDYWASPQRDREHHVVWRGLSSMVVMNRFPYTNGHLLVAHAAHRGSFAELTDDELAELSKMIRDASRVLEKVCRCDGLNVGFNLGRCAGAGVPDHLHGHVVPRWQGDTNFMAVLGNARVIPDALDVLYEELVREAAAIRPPGRPELHRPAPP